jgi:predicted anti-sigma-YlaC factor YlaD
MHYDLDTLDDYLHGELDAVHDARIHAHLETCTDCRASFDQAASVRDWIRAAAAAEELEFPSMIKARVWEEIRSAPRASGGLGWLQTGWRPWLAVPVAAALAIVGFVEYPAVHGTPAGIAASDLLLEHAAQMAGNPLADHGVVVPASTVDSERPTSSLVEAVEAVDASDIPSDGR